MQAKFNIQNFFWKISIPTVQFLETCCTTLTLAAAS